MGKAGYYSDDDTGLDLLGVRYYDPHLGCFISPDPVRDGLNWYEYAGDNPVNQIDPGGTDFVRLQPIDGSAQRARRLLQAQSPFPPAGSSFGASIWHILKYAVNVGLLAVGVPEGELETAAASTAATETAARTEAAEQGTLSSARRAAVRQAWKDEATEIRAGYRGARRWTEAEEKELLEEGKVSGYENHHINSVKDNPELAREPNNVTFRTRSEHLQEHQGNWKTPTKGSFVKRKLP